MKTYLAFDIGGTDLKYGVINNDQEIIYHSKTKTDAHLGGKSILDKIIKLSLPLIETYKPSGIAVSTAGVVNSDTGLILDATNAIPNYIGINVIDYLQSQLNLPVSIENDVNCMCLCEAHLGVSRNSNHFVALTIGTGIGGAIYTNNRILSGTSYSAGEIGMMTIEGNVFENIASTRALVNKVQASLPELNIKNGVDVYKLYDDNHPIVRKIVEEFYRILGIGIANLVYVLNPEYVVIGGGITERATFVEELTKYIEPRLTDYLKSKTKIVAASYKNNAGMMGAYLNFISRNK